MKRYEFKDMSIKIPDDQLQYIICLRSYIKGNLDIHMSLLDTYKLYDVLMQDQPKDLSEEEWVSVIKRYIDKYCVCKGDILESDLIVQAKL